MNIAYKDIGTEYEKFELYLDEQDYLKLFSDEIAFGKLLKVFEDLGRIISYDPVKLRGWVLYDSRYDGVLEVSKEICGVLENQ